MASLNSQREHVLGALEGLPGDDLRRPVLPSGWTPLGMVRHLALEVEQFWFRGAVAGEPMTLTSGDEAWRVPADVPGAAILDQYRDEIANANAIIAATPPRDAEVVARLLHRLPAPAAAQDSSARDHRDGHAAGHLDAARELIDGGEWLVLTR